MKTLSNTNTQIERQHGASKRGVFAMSKAITAREHNQGGDAYALQTNANTVCSYVRTPCKAEQKKGNTVNEICIRAMHKARGYAHRELEIPHPI